MVTLTIEFIKKQHLLNYQIQSVKYDPVDHRMDFKLTCYFKNGMPDLYANVRYFELLRSSVVMVYTTDIMYRITTTAQDYLEDLLEGVANTIRTDMKEESEHAKKNEKLLVSGPL